jgi:hypothetical protein
MENPQKSVFQGGIDTVTRNWKLFLGLVILLVVVFWLYPRWKRRYEIRKALSDSRRGIYNPLADMSALYAEYSEWFGTGDIEPYRRLLALTDQQFVLFVEKWSLKYPNLPLYSSLEEKSYPFSWAVAAERDKVLNRLQSMGLGG